MRLIDANKLGLTDFEIVMCDGDYKEALKLVLSKIRNAPTVDAVPVVRCRDCKHYGNYAECECDINGAMSSDVGYCSYGERRDEDNE